MRATGFTHVSVGARDLDEGVRFYSGLFGLEEVPHPEFASPVRWLRVGGLQLHLFQTDREAPEAHHFALDVDDFAGLLRRADGMDALAGGGFAGVRRLPDGALQAYLRDPSGNLVEVNTRGLGEDTPLAGVREIRGGPDVYLYEERREG